MREFKKLLDEKCLANEPAFCTAACPFALDMREFMEKTARGSMRGAYRLYANTVAFPDIVARFCDRPCEKVCLRDKVDKPVQIGKIEESVCALSPNKTPNNYFMPHKPEKIVIIGAGLSGLGCALKACWQKYDVTIYEATDRIGGELWEKDPTGSFLEEIKLQFKYEKPTIRLNERVDSLDDIEYDVCYVATGRGGTDFGLEYSGEGAFATNKKGVFMGGELVGRTPMEALADGLHVILSLERYLKTGLMNEPETKAGTRLHMRTDHVKPMEPVTTESSLFTKEEVQEEAARCIRCRCDACIKGCDLMNYYNKYPERIEEEVEVTIHPGTLSRDGTVCTRLIATCNHCGRCKEVCPEGIDLGSFLMDNHRIMHDKGAMPWAYHEFWLRDMEFADKEAGLLRTPPGIISPKYAFFPGCRIGGSMPDVVRKTYEYILQNDSDTAIWLNCCGISAEWAADEELHQAHIDKLWADWDKLGKPILILACESCRQSFKKYLPNIETISIYEYMAERGYAVTMSDKLPKDMAVFDPCSAREDEKCREAVRVLAQAAGVSLSSLGREGDLASCCGFGGHTLISNPHYTDEVAKARIRESELPYITYCANCRDTFAGKGKETLHILELLFGEEPDMLRSAPFPDETRYNRLKLKNDICQLFGDNAVEERKSKLIMSDELKEAIGKDMILSEDIEDVINYLEKSGDKFINPETGAYIGRKNVGKTTLWVEYKVADDGRYEVVTAYSHRMTILDK